MANPDPSDNTLDKSSAPEPAATVAAPLREGPGVKIGPYKLQQLIGEGGFGSVFMAEQEKPVQRKVALKIIKLGMDTRQVVARFEQERQALAMMDHPNIARVLDAGATETGRPYFVMELVKGDPIVEYCDKHNLSIHDRLELFAQVCSAVQHAHTKGIIHRDIKPSNILVSAQDGRPNTKVIDFGVAKATSARLTDLTLFTEQRQLIGTPEYMSPEQAEGSLDIDTRTDVYSLGVLLYELLTGTTPFSTKELRSAGYNEIQRIIREVEPPKPSARLTRSPTTIAGVAARRSTEPRKLGTIIRGELDWIVMKALEKDRMRRYETANGLAMDIRRHLAGEAVVAAPPGAAYRLKKFVRRNRAIVAASAAVAAALLIGIVGFAWQAQVAREQRDIAVNAQKSEAVQRKTAEQQRRIAEEQREAAGIAADRAERAAYQAQLISAGHAVEDQQIDSAGALLAATAPRLRGWEYRHLTSQLDRTLPSPFPAEWQISGFNLWASRTVAVRRSVAGGPIEWVVLDSDLRTPRLVVPDADWASFGLSPDESRVVWAPVVGDPRPAVLWDIQTKAVLASLPIENEPAPDSTLLVSWSPSGDRFVISHPDGYQIHDGRSGARLRAAKLKGDVLFTGDDRWMIEEFKRAFSRRALQLLDAQTLESHGAIFNLDSPLNQMSCRQARVVCALESGTILMLEIVDGALQERFKVPAGISNFSAGITFSPDGRMIAASSSVVGRMRVWDADTGALLHDFSASETGIVAQQFLSGDLCACDRLGHHRIWPLHSTALGVLTAHKSYVYPAVFSPDGSLLLTAGWDGLTGHTGGLKLWDAHTSALVAEYGKPGEIFMSAGLTPDARFAVASTHAELAADRQTKVIDLTSGATRTTFKPPVKIDRPRCTVIDPDGQRALTIYHEGETFLWDLSTGKVLWQTHLHPKPESTVPSITSAISPDGRLWALCDGQLGIRLVNADTLADVRRWDAHSDGIWSLSFSPDGKWLLSASEDQTVGVWDVASGSLVARLVGRANILCAVVSPDGTRIATGGRDRLVRLWDTTHFENVAQLGGHTDYIYALAWSPDGQQLVSTSGDSTVRIWDTRTFAEQIAAQRERLDELPRFEAAIARARANAHDDAERVRAVEAVIAKPQFTVRERDLAQQAAARFAFRGMPAYYRAPRAAAPLTIDGKLDEAVWNATPWSDPFVDIEGDAKPKPRFETRMKMCWDDTNLYVAATLEEPHVWGTLTNRDDIVFRDNDFEVFVDPEGDTHWYGEVEVNALGTIFDLRLERPYLDGGPAHHEWSPPGMRAAVHIDGTLNDPTDTDRGWTVEIAIPHAAFADHATAPLPPHPGDIWRINFSRVEWLHDVVDGRYVKRPETKEDNWVWTPQHVVNMHVPREWGFVEFVAGPK